MSENTIVRLKPPGPVGEAFIHDDSFVSMLMGCYGSGKTTAAVAAMVRNWEMTKPDRDGIKRWYGVCMRSTYQQIVSNMLPTIEKVLPKEITEDKLGSPITKVIKKDNLIATLYFIGCDQDVDRRRLEGFNLNFFWCDETRETNLPIISTAISRVRVTNDMQEEQPLRVIFTSNPSSQNFWMYEKFSGPDAVPGWKIFRQPSGLSPDAENTENLKKGYYEDLAAMNDPSWVNVHVHGNWGQEVIGASCVPDFRENLHVAPDVIQYAPTLPLILSADAGPTLNSAALVSQIVPLMEGDKTVGRQLRIMNEYFFENMGAVRAAQALKEFVKQDFPGLNVEQVIGDPAMFEQRECGNEQIFSNIWEGITGYQFRKAPTNLVHLRIEALRGLFQRLIHGNPAVIISPNCKNLISALSGQYRWKSRSTPSGTTVTETLDKANTPFCDFGDAAGYLALGTSEYSILKDTAQRGRNRNRSDSRIIVPGTSGGSFYDGLYGED